MKYYRILRSVGVVTMTQQFHRRWTSFVHYNINMCSPVLQKLHASGTSSTFLKKYAASCNPWNTLAVYTGIVDL